MKSIGFYHVVNRGVEQRKIYMDDYFNKKYKRVGPLWQGRFKSWYVYDESYLKSLVKYIEFNPIKAKMIQKIGQFQWAMSSKKNIFSGLNYKLIDNMDLNKNFSEKELQNIDNLFNAKLIVVDELVILKVKKKLEVHFKNKHREVAIANALNSLNKVFKCSLDVGCRKTP